MVAAVVAAVLGASSPPALRAQVPSSTSTSTPPTSVTTTVRPTSSSSTSSSTTPPSAPELSTSTSSGVPDASRSTPPAAEPTVAAPTVVAPTGDDPPPGASATSISDEAVAAFLGSLQRTPASSTQALLDALRPLQDLGVSAHDAAMLGMGRFPVAGEAFFRDDFLEYRAGPPVHGHQGNDIWAVFDAPVRSPADGVIRFEEGGLGGKAAYVTEPDGTFYYLAHLNGFAPGLESGSPVTTGQLIAFNGDSGNAKGGAPHVHFEIHPRGGPAVNPKPILEQWLADALAGVPALLRRYLPTGTGNRPVAAVGMARHFDGGLLSSRPIEEPDLGRARPGR